VAESPLLVEDLSRPLGRFHAIEHVSFELRPGQVAALVGHESSGTAAVLRSIIGLLRPAAGTVRINGRDIYGADRTALRAVGACLSPPRFVESWTGRRNLEYAADLCGPRDEQRINWAVSRTGLSGRIDEWVHVYSPSFRQRLGVARALVGGPKLLVLDEPLTDLDAETARSFTVLFRKLARDAEVAVLVVSQSLQGVTTWVERTIVIDGGRILHDGPTRQIQAAGREVAITVDRAEKAAEDLIRVRGISAELTSMETLRIGGHIDVAEIVAFLSGRRFKVTGVARHEMTLDELIVRLSTGPLPPPPPVTIRPDEVTDPLELLDDGDTDLSAFLKKPDVPGAEGEAK
jgi:ABC-2 type transport system ATP-binding protein